LDTGARLLLIDEDRSATNFMIRDKMMKELISKEPITPFTDRARELYKSLGVSVIVVIGGSGEYLSVADRVYLMEDYLISDVTEKSRRMCLENRVKPEKTDVGMWCQGRKLLSDGFTSYPQHSTSERLEVSDLGFILIGDEKIDVRGIHDVISRAQLDALGFMLRYLEISNKDRVIDIRRRVDELYRKLDKEGIDLIYSAFFTTTRRFLELPRKSELYAVISRMRNIRFENV